MHACVKVKYMHTRRCMVSKHQYATAKIMILLLQFRYFQLYSINGPAPPLAPAGPPVAAPAAPDVLALYPVCPVSQLYTAQARQGVYLCHTW